MLNNNVKLATTKMILSIHSFQRDSVTVSLSYNSFTRSLTRHSSVSSQLILSLIEEMLTTNNIPLANITHLEVDSGPGSYTSLRVGAITGSILSWLLTIPINENPSGCIPELQYEQNDKYV